MDTLEFVAAMTGSLVWPVSVCGVLIAYRRPITKRLSKLRHVKYKEFEAFFGREVRELKAEVREPLPVIGIGHSKQAPQTIEGHGSVSALKMPASPTADALNDAERLIKNDLADAAIFSAWATVETELRAFLRANGMGNYASPQVSTREQINALAQSTIADNQTIDVLRRMYNLFEMLAYTGAGSDLATEDNAREYVALAQGVIKRLDQLGVDKE